MMCPVSSAVSVPSSANTASISQTLRWGVLQIEKQPLARRRYRRGRRSLLCRSMRATPPRPMPRSKNCARWRRSPVFAWSIWRARPQRIRRSNHAALRLRMPAMPPAHGEDPEVLRRAADRVPALRRPPGARAACACGRLQGRRLVRRWLRQLEAEGWRRRQVEREQKRFGRGEDLQRYVVVIHECAELERVTDGCFDAGGLLFELRQEIEAAPALSHLAAASNLEPRTLNLL